jgi:hypothetical protein
LYVNPFSIKTGVLYERIKEIEKNMSESEKIILNRKLSEIQNTVDWIAAERSRDQAK